MEPLIIRNRKITTEDLPLIQAVVNEHWDRCRTYISKELCKYWNWVQPSGRLKDMACRELLLTLHRKGLIDYPSPKASSYNVSKAAPVIHVDQSLINCTLDQLSPVRVEMVRYTEYEPLYNSLVDQFHYLGYSQIVGNHLKYMAFSGDVPLTCIGWGSAAWAVKSREQFIGWPNPVKNQRLHYIANNTRYLILPWVTVKCLASKILALNIRRIIDDWNRVYHFPLYLLETFVEQERFKGTCYQAANWIHVGETKGTSKKGHKHLKNDKVKDVYLYPMHKHFKKLLTGDGISQTI